MGKRCLQRQREFHAKRRGNTNWYFHSKGFSDWNSNFNWVRTINGYLNRHINGYLHWNFNRVGLGDPPVYVHRVRPIYWHFNRDRHSDFNWIGTFNRDWNFNWYSFDYSDRPVYYNRIGMIDRHFDPNWVRFRDSNWDLDRVWLRLRDGNGHFYRVGVVNTDRNFHRVGSVNWDPHFNRVRFRDWDLLKHWIRSVDGHRDFYTNWVGFWDLDSLGDDLRESLSGVETSQAFAEESKA